MKKIVASVGLVALGASGIHSASAQGVQAPDESKPWSVSATLRGFYDSNTGSIPDNQPLPPGQDKESFGWEVSPSAAFKWERPQTVLSLGYVYSYKYYENPIPYSTSHDQQSHIFNGSLTHNFSERYTASVFDSFVLGQEPDLLRVGPGNTFETFQTVPGDNMRNYGGINFNADLSRTFATELGYANQWVDYDDEGAGSLSAVLDRLEHYIHADLKWKAAPQTTGILGYQFGVANYTADEPLTTLPPLNPLIPVPVSEDRNTRSHYLYTGVDHVFTPDLTGSARVGARYTDYYNVGEESWSPYLRGSLRYYYLPESFLEGGISYDLSPTDVVGGLTANNMTLDADTFTIFGTVTHKILPKLFGSLTAQFQNTKFNGGVYDGETEQIYIAGVELEYRINRYLAAHAGYNFDYLESDIDRGFDRNRVYIGVTASY